MIIGGGAGIGRLRCLMSPLILINSKQFSALVYIFSKAILETLETGDDHIYAIGYG